jgi:hypothetical protein
MSATAFETLIVPTFQATLLGVVAGSFALALARSLGSALFREDDRPGPGEAGWDGAWPEDLFAKSAPPQGRGEDTDRHDPMLFTGPSLSRDHRPTDPRDELARLGLLFPAVRSTGREAERW